MDSNDIFKVSTLIALENEKAIRESRKKVKVHYRGENTMGYPIILPKSIVPSKKKLIGNKIAEYIELLNSGDINDEFTNDFFLKYKEKIISTLENNERYSTGYEFAKRLTEIMLLPLDMQKEQLELLKKEIIQNNKLLKKSL